MKVALGVLVGLPGMAVGQAAPRVHYAPDRTYDLIRTVTSLHIQAKRQRATGDVVATFAMLRDGITRVHFDTTAERVRDVRIDGKPAKFTHSGGSLDVDVPKGRRGEIHRLSVRIEGSFFRWTQPTAEEPNRVGFCAEGMGAQPVGWSAPNDLASTEVRITVPTEWTAISNGALISDQPVKGSRHTVTWRLDLPHAGYLNSLAVGPYDVYRDTWRGKPLIMTCPKGMGDRLKSTFAQTKDILDYYSDVLNFPYPWPKYAQTVVYEHEGYAEEDVTATQYPIYWRADGEFMFDPREGMGPTEWVIAHETAHQWFGDTVTCRDWGDTWLNEGVTTFMEMMYTRHHRGPLEALREYEAYSQRYFSASKSDFRPVATNFYSDSVGMGGWTTYMKGGTVLDSLRRQIGDSAFFQGMHKYLVRHQFGNVESNDLCEDLTEASGVNLHPWFEQWVYKPGHPIIDWSWTYEPTRKTAVVHVRQTQDTSKGTPIFDVPTHVGLVGATSVERAPIHLNAADQTFEIPASVAPVAVLFDPDHEFVREIPKQPWRPEELTAIFLNAPSPTDMEAAMNALLEGTPSDDTLRLIAQRLRQDTQPFPAIPNTARLANLRRPVLHDFFLAETLHASFDRRTQATAGLARLNPSPADLRRLTELLAVDQPYDVVIAAMQGLADHDVPAVLEFAKAQATRATYAPLRRAALNVLADHKVLGWESAIVATAAETNRPVVREVGLQALRRLPLGETRQVSALRSGVQSRDSRVATTAIRLVGELKVAALTPDLQRLKSAGQHSAEVDAALKALGK